MHRSSSVRPSLNLPSLFAETELRQDENWMISYIDVFVLMTTIFVMLLVLNKQQPALPLDESGKIAQLVVPENLEIIAELTKPHSLSDDSHWFDSISESIQQHGLGDLVQLNKDANFTELQIQSRVLFDSGDSELTRSGVSLLEKLLPVLMASEGLIFVEGHTDDRPIGTQRFRSNWDLASARATEVLQFFVAEGMTRERFRAVSYGDTKPIVANDTEQNRRKNRRVSLMIQRQAVL